MEMIDILKAAVDKEASDIHIVIGMRPMIRSRGEIVPLRDFPQISAEESRRLIYSILYDDQKQRFEETKDMDCAFEIKKLSRFRVNVLLQINGVEAVLRIVSSKIPDPETIRLAPSVVSLADLPRGLVLVTGPTGSGKSTTLASLIQLVNQKYSRHILTIEDPIEFVHEPVCSIVRQREVGQSTQSFASALRAALREDPDVIMVGEMRDLETISLAITAAETGHLCFGTLHTSDAPQTIDRIIDVFPPSQQHQVRTQLSNSLKAVISQSLLPRKDTDGRIAAREIMIVTPAISNLIREGKTHMIVNQIETGGKFGMITMDKALLELVRSGLVSIDDACAQASNPEALRAGKAGIQL
jgi:twitching motility protein PilT